MKELKKTSRILLKSQMKEHIKNRSEKIEYAKKIAAKKGQNWRDLLETPVNNTFNFNAKYQCNAVGESNSNSISQNLKSYSECKATTHFLHNGKTLEIVEGITPVFIGMYFENRLKVPFIINKAEIKIFKNTPKLFVYLDEK